MDSSITPAIVVTLSVMLIICVIGYKLIRMIVRIFTGGKSGGVPKMFRDIDLLADAVENKEVKLGPEVRAILNDIYKKVDNFSADIDPDSDIYDELLEPLERILNKQ